MTVPGRSGPSSVATPTGAAIVMIRSGTRRRAASRPHRPAARSSATGETRCPRGIQGLGRAYCIHQLLAKPQLDLAQRQRLQRVRQDRVGFVGRPGHPGALVAVGPNLRSSGPVPPRPPGTWTHSPASRPPRSARGGPRGIPQRLPRAGQIPPGQPTHPGPPQTQAVEVAADAGRGQVCSLNHILDPQLPSMGSRRPNASRTHTGRADIDSS